MSTPFWDTVSYQTALLDKERCLAIDWFARCVRSMVKSGKRVLDVGCGPAVLVHALKQLGYKVDGVDISKTAQKLALEPVTIADVTVDDPAIIDGYDITFCMGLADLLSSEELFGAAAYIGQSTRMNGWIIVSPSVDDADPYYPAHVIDTALLPFAKPSAQLSSYIWYAYTSSDVWTGAPSYASARVYRRVVKDHKQDVDWFMRISENGERLVEAAKLGRKVKATR